MSTAQDDAEVVIAHVEEKGIDELEYKTSEIPATVTTSVDGKLISKTEDAGAQHVDHHMRKTMADTASQSNYARFKNGISPNSKYGSS